MNFLDNVDGVSAGVAAVSAATVTIVAVSSGQFVVAVAAAALAGACLGYLVHNFPPARLFMGDMGALAVGFALASLTLALRPKQTSPLSIVVAILALGVPIFDTTLVTVSRLRAGLSPSTGGTDHTSHRLLERGYSLRSVLGVLVAAQVVLGGLAVALAVSSRGVGWAIAAVAALVGLGALAVSLRLSVWTPPVHAEVSEDVRHALARALEAIRAFEQSATDSGLVLSDPVTVRALREGTRRLEAMHTRLTGDLP
jgi:UDP-GlcNAc:undecaprenyl-phosphate GlcNAc-1-phosphate transferase